VGRDPDLGEMTIKLASRECRIVKPGRERVLEKARYSSNRRESYQESRKGNMAARQRRPTKKTAGSKRGSEVEESIWGRKTRKKNRSEGGGEICESGGSRLMRIEDQELTVPQKRTRPRGKSIIRIRRPEDSKE